MLWKEMDYEYVSAFVGQMKITSHWSSNILSPKNQIPSLSFLSVSWQECCNGYKSENMRQNKLILTEKVCLKVLDVREKKL